LFKFISLFPAFFYIPGGAGFLPSTVSFLANRWVSGDCGRQPGRISELISIADVFDAAKVDEGLNKLSF